MKSLESVHEKSEEASDDEMDDGDEEDFLNVLPTCFNSGKTEVAQQEKNALIIYQKKKEKCPYCKVDWPYVRI